MKKIVFLILTSFLLTACTNIDASFGNLYIRRGINVSYVIDVKTLNKNNEYIHLKSYIKGDKFKTMFLNNDKIETVYFYDGGDTLYKYDVKTKKLTETPVAEEMRRENALNIVGHMVYWRKPVGMSLLDYPEPQVISRKEMIEDQPCTMIEFGPQREACISNKSRIALYHKFQNQTFYLERVKKAHISDEEFKILKE